MAKQRDDNRTYSPGEKLASLPARLLNDMRRVVDKERALEGLEQSSIDLNLPDIVWIENNRGTAADIKEFGVVGVGEPTSHIWEDSSEYKEKYSFKSKDPNPNSLFAILQQPIETDTLGWAKTDGMTKARVYFSNKAHKYANVISGDYAKLTSQASIGPARIIESEIPPDTELDGGIDIDDTELTVKDPEPWQEIIGQFVAQIGTEKILVTAVVGAVWTIVRAHAGTTASGHGTGVAVTFVSGITVPTVLLQQVLDLAATVCICVKDCSGNPLYLRIPQSMVSAEPCDDVNEEKKWYCLTPVTGSGSGSSGPTCCGNAYLGGAFVYNDALFEAGTSNYGERIDTTFTVPPGITKMLIVAIGGGGGGGYNLMTDRGGGGGGGGAAVCHCCIVTPGQILTLYGGLGGAWGNSLTGPEDGLDGEDVSIVGTGINVLAKGGKGGKAAGAGGAGGSASGSIGSSKFSGGDGGLGDPTSTDEVTAGFSAGYGTGGGSGGPTGAGTDGEDFHHGYPKVVGEGGPGIPDVSIATSTDGGDGAGASVFGEIPSSPITGGGGGYGSLGGRGAGGKIIFIFSY